MTVKGYMVGYRSTSAENYEMDGILVKKNGKYELLKSDRYRNDGSINLVLVNLYSYLRKNFSEYEDVAGSVLENIIGMEMKFPDREVSTAFNSEELKEGSLMRIHYLTEEQVENAIYIRVSIKGVKTEDGVMDFNYTLKNVGKLKGFKDAGLSEKEISELYRDTHITMLEEAVALRVLMTTKVTE